MENDNGMARVSSCTVAECTFNLGGICRARAITVGAGSGAYCGTFFCSGIHCKADSMAGVGACQIKRCRYNNDFSCTAPAITVGLKGIAAECRTCRIQ